MAGRLRRRSRPAAHDAIARAGTYAAAYTRWEIVENAAIALQAARTKNLEKAADATDNIADACVNCHEVYRDKDPADGPARCTPARK